MKSLKLFIFSAVALLLISCTNIFTPNDKGKITVNFPGNQRTIFNSEASTSTILSENPDGIFYLILADSSGKIIEKADCTETKSKVFEDLNAGKYVLECGYTTEEGTLAYAKKEVLVEGGKESTVQLELTLNRADRIVNTNLVYKGKTEFSSKEEVVSFTKDQFLMDLYVEYGLNNGWKETIPYLSETGFIRSNTFVKNDTPVETRNGKDLYSVIVAYGINGENKSQNFYLYAPAAVEVECATWAEVKSAVENATAGIETLIKLTTTSSIACYEVSQSDKLVIPEGKKIIIEPKYGVVPTICPAGSDGLEAFFEVEGTFTIQGSDYGTLIIQGTSGESQCTIAGTAIKALNGSTITVGQNVFFSNILSNSGDGNILGAAISMDAGSKVSIEGDSTNEVMFIGCKITYNYYALGGAIYNNGGELSINNASFSGCTVLGDSEEHNGGAIFSSGKLKISNTEFESCIAGYSGGAIYLDEGTAELSNITFNSNNQANNGSGHNLYIHENVSSVIVDKEYAEIGGNTDVMTIK